MVIGILLLIGTILALSVLSQGVNAEPYDENPFWIETTGAPQLSIESVIPEKYEIERNEIINITVSVRNDGDEEARFVDIYYEIDGEQQYYKTIDSIAPDSTETSNFTFSESTIGEYYLTYIGKDDGVEFDRESITIRVVGPTHYVDDDAPEGGDGSKEHPYNEIQEAVDNAVADDTIRVFEGTYLENVQIDKTLNVIGNGSANTIIDGEGSGDLVYISSDWVNFSGFSVINVGRTDACIYVYSDHNTIENTMCSANVSRPDMDVGIFLDRSDQNTIIDNVLTNNTMGIRMSGSSSNSIRRNEFSINTESGKDGHDLYVTGSHDNTFEGNTFQKMYLYGSDRNMVTKNVCSEDRIKLYMAERNHVNENTFTNAFFEIQSSDKSFIRDNVFKTDQQKCIDIENTYNLTITGNEMTGGGILFEGWEFGNWNTHIIDSSNTVNGDEIHYRKNSTNFEVPDDMGQVILANCTNGLVKDQTYTNVSGGIQIGYSSFIEITGATCSENYYGMFIEYSDNITIQKSEFSGNYYGVVIEDCNDIMFIRNNCSNNGNDGLRLEEVYYITIRGNEFHSNEQSGVGANYRVEWSTIEDNICDDNEIGIYIENCYDPTLVNNNICTNNQYGILIPDSRFITVMNNTCNNNDVGIYIRESNIINLTNNSVSENSYAGIYFRDARDCLVNLSNISDNFNGILFRSGSHDISFQYNNIRGNSEYGANASENDETLIDCTNNWWGDGSGPYHEDENPDGEGDAVTDFIEFDPWLPRKFLPPTADFMVSPYFDTGLAIDDSNDPIENGIIDVFYGDGIVFQEMASDPEDDPLTFDWEFHCEITEYTTTASGETVSGEVGTDFLYVGMDGSDPIISDDIVDYMVTLFVSDGVSTISKEYTIRVHPYATENFLTWVNIGPTILEASVTLTWRGFKDEAAPSPQYISPERPVFVHIDEVESPVENLHWKGGIGLVYELRSVGCHLQNGEEGFIEAEISLPILTADLAEIGDSFMLQDHLRLEYFDEELERFLIVDGSHVESDGGVKYVRGTVDHFSIYTAIVDSLYNSSHPDHYSVLPDLSVLRIEFSRKPVLDGQDVEIRGQIKNTGPTHARNVDVTFYDGDDLIGTQNIEIVEGSGGRTEATNQFTATLHNSENSFEEHDIKVHVNEHQTLEEAPGNFDNNLGEELLIVTALQKAIPIPEITAPENGATVIGDVTIEGTIAYDGSVVTMVDQPFGNNNFAWHIERVEPNAVPIYFARYSLVDDYKENVSGGAGKVEDIYGLNFDDQFTNISYQDNDRDGMISAGDVFLGKNTVNGGIVSAGYSLHLEFLRPEQILISIDHGEWTLLEDSIPWTYEWNTSLVDNGDYSLQFQAMFGSESSDISEITLTVENIPDNIIPEISITSPLNFSEVSGTVMISGLASDEDGNVEWVEILIHNGSWQIIQATVGWAFEWDTEKLENGDYIILVRSYDGTDYSPEVSTTVTVNNEEDSDEDDGFEIAGIEAIVILPIIVVCISLVIVGAIVRTRSREEVRAAKPRKKFICPICEGSASYNKAKKQWMCHRCKKLIGAG